MSRRVLVAGASGALGRHVVEELSRRGYRVRALARSAARLRSQGIEVPEVHEGDALKPATLARAFEGVDDIFSCLGASVAPSPMKGWASFSAVDGPANKNLIDAAVAAGVARFVYVSVFGAERFLHLEYCRAHEQVVDALRKSPLSFAVIRPTGFFSALEAFVDMAARGPVAEMGTGEAKTNPIHDADLAAVCVDALEGGERERDVGGPEVLTRRQIAELACRAVGRAPSLRRVPLGLVRASGLALRPLSPRLSHLFAFFATIMEHDLIAPPAGTRTLGAFFEESARRRGLGP